MLPNLLRKKLYYRFLPLFGINGYLTVESFMERKREFLANRILKGLRDKLRFMRVGEGKCC